MPNVRSYQKASEYLASVLEADFSCQGSSVFYSKGLFGSNRGLAEEYTAAYGGSTLEQTPIGRFLEGECLFGEFLDQQGIFVPVEERRHPDQPEVPWNRQEAQRVWVEASRRFAAAAKGHVVAFIEPSAREGIFSTVELPALLNNPNITAINGVSKQRLDDLSGMMRSGPTEAVQRLAADTLWREIAQVPLQIERHPELQLELPGGIDL